ncbi:MAG: YidC/Oxa1 family insertase periplasmic-domain containing protein [Phycisphaerae bacterium]|nr:YidC/Oxa1 family insertase periplasmic-domain containing protein [Phycisphaerae bacterium]
MRNVLILTIIGFCLLCGGLVIESGLFECSGPCILLQKTTDEEAPKASDANEATVEKKTPKLKAAVSLRADDAEVDTLILGARDPNTEDPETGYKFQLELSSKGAAIRKATFSNGNGNGFDDRDPDNPQPLVVFSPVKTEGGGEILAMANTQFVFTQRALQLPLDGLHWKSIGVEKAEGRSQIARFEAIIKIKDTGEPVMKLTKTYTVRPNSYLLDCDITVENLSPDEENIYFKMNGPGGLGREAFRTDMRKVVAGFEDSDGEIASMVLDKKTLHKAGSDVKARRLKKPGANFLWVAAVNKYFAAILVPQPNGDKSYCDWMTDRLGWSYDPDGEANSGDENISLDLTIESQTLDAKGQAGSSIKYKFQLYIGPKDKSFFDKNDMYRKLGFVHTIDFMVCCCPASIIKPLAFGILTIMKAMYGVIGNYGVVIIILVFCVRIVMHPVTKKSQVSMSKMQKLGPMAEEIKKKYANNKAEMNKKMMALYREQGASPIMGFLPMMIQMPIWIALWSAVYASIDLRGAAFLPFWITDLSLPDALFRFPAVKLPLFGKLDSFNLLPLMMGVAFYLQQKLMPKQGAAATNPQVAQQQKMMMIMMPLLFPLMLYKAPSGVNLYIMSSTFAGVIEQYVIRKHIREKDEADSQGLVATTKKTGGKVKKKKPKPFFKT